MLVLCFLLLFAAMVSLVMAPHRFQTMLGAVVIDLDFQYVHDRYGQQQEHKHRDPLELLVELDAGFEAPITVHQL